MSNHHFASSIASGAGGDDEEGNELFGYHTPPSSQTGMAGRESKRAISRRRQFASVEDDDDDDDDEEEEEMNSVLREFLQVLSAGGVNLGGNRGSRSQSVRVTDPARLKHHLSKRYTHESNLVLEFKRGFKSIMNRSDSTEFLKLLLPYRTDTAGVVEDESLCRLLLSVPQLQSVIGPILLENLFRASNSIRDRAHYEQLRFDENIPKLILRQFSLLTFIQDVAQMKRKINDLMSGNLPEYIQHDLIRMIPEILVDHIDEKIIEMLKAHIEADPDLHMPVVLEAFSDFLFPSQSILKTAQEMVFERFSSAKVEHIPNMVKFLLATVTENTVIDVVTNLRECLKTDFFDPIALAEEESNLSISDDDNVISQRKRRRYNQARAETQRAKIVQQENSSVFIVDALTTSIKFKPHLQKEFIKQIESTSEDEMTELDVWVLIISCTFQRYVKKADALLKRKVKSLTLGERLISQSIRAPFHRALGGHLFKILLNLAANMLAHTDATLNKMGQYLYVVLFKTFTSKLDQHTLLELLTTHMGSQKSREVDLALDVMLDLAKHDLKSMRTFDTFLERMLDNDYLSPHMIDLQLRKLYALFSTLAYTRDISEDDNDGGEEDALFEGGSLSERKHHRCHNGGSVFANRFVDQLRILVTKQLGNRDIGYKRMGIIGAVNIISHIGTQAKEFSMIHPQHDPHALHSTNVQLLDMDQRNETERLITTVFDCCETSPLCQTYLFDTLHYALQFVQLDEGIRKFLEKRSWQAFERFYVNESPGQFQLASPWKLSVTPTAIGSMTSGGCLNIASDIINSVHTHEMQGYDHLQSTFSVLRLGQHIMDPNTRSKLIEVPLFAFGVMDVQNGMKRLTTREKECIGLTLFNTINWYREVVNSCTDFLVDPEMDEDWRRGMSGTAIGRLCFMMELISLLDEIIFKTPTFAVPRVHFALLMMDKTPDSITKAMRIFQDKIRAAAMSDKPSATSTTKKKKPTKKKTAKKKKSTATKKKKKLSRKRRTNDGSDEDDDDDDNDNEEEENDDDEGEDIEEYDEDETILRESTSSGEEYTPNLNISCIEPLQPFLREFDINVVRLLRFCTKDLRCIRAVYLVLSDVNSKLTQLIRKEKAPVMIAGRQDALAGRNLALEQQSTLEYCELITTIMPHMFELFVWMSEFLNDKDDDDDNDDDDNNNEEEMTDMESIDSNGENARKARLERRRQRADADIGHRIELTKYLLPCIRLLLSVWEKHFATIVKSRKKNDLFAQSVKVMVKQTREAEEDAEYDNDVDDYMEDESLEQIAEVLSLLASYIDKMDVLEDQAKLLDVMIVIAKGIPSDDKAQRKKLRAENISNTASKMVARALHEKVIKVHSDVFAKVIREMISHSPSIGEYLVRISKTDLPQVLQSTSRFIKLDDNTVPTRLQERKDIRSKRVAYLRATLKVVAENSALNAMTSLERGINRINITTHVLHQMCMAVDNCDSQTKSYLLLTLFKGVKDCVPHIMKYFPVVQKYVRNKNVDRSRMTHTVSKIFASVSSFVQCVNTLSIEAKKEHSSALDTIISSISKQMRTLSYRIKRFVRDNEKLVKLKQTAARPMTGLDVYKDLTKKKKKGDDLLTSDEETMSENDDDEEEEEEEEEEYQRRRAMRKRVPKRTERNVTGTRTQHAKKRFMEASDSDSNDSERSVAETPAKRKKMQNKKAKPRSHDKRAAARRYFREDVDEEDDIFDFLASPGDDEKRDENNSDDEEEVEEDSIGDPHDGLDESNDDGGGEEDSEDEYEF